jgi:hypothetical protein
MDYGIAEAIPDTKLEFFSKLSSRGVLESLFLEEFDSLGEGEV